MCAALGWHRRQFDSMLYRPKLLSRCQTVIFCKSWCCRILRELRLLQTGPAMADRTHRAVEPRARFNALVGQKIIGRPDSFRSPYNSTRYDAKSGEDVLGGPPEPL